MFNASSFFAVVSFVVVQAGRLLVKFLISLFYDETQPDGYCQNNDQHRNADAENDDDSFAAVVRIVLFHAHPFFRHDEVFDARLTLLARISIINARITRVTVGVVLVSTRLYRYPLRT